MTTSLTIVIPAFNEGPSLKTMVRDLSRVFESAAVDVEWIFVDDGSTDNTKEEMQAIAAQFDSAQVISHEANRGLGAAVHSGFQAATGRLVTWAPADGQIHGTDILKGYQASDSQTFAILIRRESSRNFFRRIMTFFFFCLGRLLANMSIFGFSGICVAPNHLTRQVPLISNTSLQTTAVLLFLLKSGLQKNEVKIDVRNRIEGHSKCANVKEVRRVILDMLRLRRQMKGIKTA